MAYSRNWTEKKVFFDVFTLGLFFQFFSVFSSVAKISRLETYFPNMGVRALESPFKLHMGNVPPQWGDKKICNAIWPGNVFRTVSVTAIYFLVLDRFRDPEIRFQ